MKREQKGILLDVILTIGGILIAIPLGVAIGFLLLIEKIDNYRFKNARRRDI